MRDGDVPRITLIALFVTALLTGQILAVKILGVALPVSLPVVGGAIIVPAGVLAYALTFFATDCLAELYGRRTAQTVVNVGFGMNLVLIALIAIGIVAPSAWAMGLREGVDPAAFATVLGFTPNVILGSLTAYLVSQHWDVLAFHAIRERTGRGHLWVRNLGSTATSQLVDTVIFIVVTFLAAPLLLGIGQPSPLPVIASLIVGQYLLKLLIAAADTPFVYLVVGYVRSSGAAGRRATVD